MIKTVLTITKQDLTAAGDYVDNLNCLATTAAKRQFNTTAVYAQSQRIRIDGLWFNLSRADARKIEKAYPPGLIGRPRVTARPFSVTLTPV